MALNINITFATAVKALASNLDYVIAQIQGFINNNLDASVVKDSSKVGGFSTAQASGGVAAVVVTNASGFIDASFFYSSGTNAATLTDIATATSRSGSSTPGPNEVVILNSGGDLDLTRYGREIYLPNNRVLRSLTTPAGLAKNLIQCTSANVVQVGDVTVPANIVGSAVTINSVAVATTASTVAKALQANALQDQSHPANYYALVGIGSFSITVSGGVGSNDAVIIGDSSWVAAMFTVTVNSGAGLVAVNYEQNTGAVRVINLDANETNVTINHAFFVRV